MIIGNINKLIVDRKTDIGYMLKDQDGEEVFLHFNDCDDKEIEVGSKVNAFLYFDSKNRVAATLQIPFITTTDCDFVEVIDILHFGVFVNIGIKKDILLSKDDLPLDKQLWPIKGDKVYAYLKSDKNKALLIDLATRDDYLDIKVEAPKELLRQKIDVRVFKLSTEGVNVISDEGYIGFIHHSEYKDQPRFGQLLEDARVIGVRDDGEINLSLIPQKEIAVKEDAEMIYDYLIKNDGVMPLCDKSSPEEIVDELSISKAAFKRAVGKLMRDNKVEQDLDNRCTTLL